jgi:hypothetical protein
MPCAGASVAAVDAAIEEGMVRRLNRQRRQSSIAKAYERWLESACPGPVTASRCIDVPANARRNVLFICPSPRDTQNFRYSFAFRTVLTSAQERVASRPSSHS